MIKNKELKDVIKILIKTPMSLNCKMYFFFKCCTNKTVYLSNQCGSSARLILPVRSDL